MKIKKGDLVKIDMTFGESTEIVSDYGVVLETFQEMQWTYGEDPDNPQYRMINLCSIYWINNNDLLLRREYDDYGGLRDNPFITTEEEENLSLVKSAKE